MAGTIYLQLKHKHKALSRSQINFGANMANGADDISRVGHARGRAQIARFGPLSTILAGMSMTYRTAATRACHGYTPASAIKR
jgi:hypothetical protein